MQRGDPWYVKIPIDPTEPIRGDLRRLANGTIEVFDGLDWRHETQAKGRPQINKGRPRK